MAERQDTRTVCAICLENIGPSVELARPSVCEHKFCRACLESFCRSSPNVRRCPLDRKSFDKICVLGPAGGETMYDAVTMVELGRHFTSPTVPASLACLLLAVLWVSPNWLLVVHIASIGGIYWYTDGIANWELYILHIIGFYYCLVPMKFFGFYLTAYAWACSVLVFFMCRQVPDLTSGNLTPEKVLLLFTCTLTHLIFPCLFFSVYALAQTCCYLIGAIFAMAMHAKLCDAFGHRYFCFSLLFSSMVLAPFLCLLSELTLPHVVYNCVLAAYLFWVANSVGDPNDQPQQHKLFVVGTFLTKLACYFAPSVILGFSPWTVLYTVAMLSYFTLLIQLNLLARLNRSVPLLVIVNYAMVGLLLPWRLIGLLSYLVSLVPVSGSCVLADHLINRISSLPNGRLLFLLLLQFLVLGILLPAAVF